MKEREWLECAELRPMLRCICEQFHLTSDNTGARKMRLFACALARTVWNLIPARQCQDAVSASEEFADGRIEGEQVERQWRELAEWEQEGLLGGTWCDIVKLRRAISGDQWGKNAILLAQAAKEVRQVESSILEDAGASEDVREAFDVELETQHLKLFRDFFGNPFRSVALPSSCLKESAILKLAQLIYDERELPSGRLDNGRLNNGRLPILADALEEAGCSDAAILGHCRQRGAHVRGCWVVDLILSKDR